MIAQIAYMTLCALVLMFLGVYFIAALATWLMRDYTIDRLNKRGKNNERK